MKMKTKYIGSNFDDFLLEENLLEHASAIAIKRVMVIQIEQAMETQELTKLNLAKKSKMSIAEIDRLLDENDTDMTLATLVKVAIILGKRVRVELIDT
jgi:predicted XRE-type DNA-binding protein